MVNKTYEKALEKSILDWLSLNKIFAFSVNCGNIPIYDKSKRFKRMFRATNINGVPDIVCCYNGKFYGLECKVGYNKQSDYQKTFEANLKNAGGIYAVVHSIEDVANVFRLPSGYIL